MSKKYLIKLDGWIKDRLEIEASKRIFTYTTIIKMALSDFFDKLDEESKK